MRKKRNEFHVLKGQSSPTKPRERLRKLLTAIHDEAEQLLESHEVYEVHGYAWLDQDTPDPEYIGHAMWELTPPFQHDWMGLQRGGTVTYEPTERDEILLRNGEDFIGSMEFARRSLGMAGGTT